MTHDDTALFLVGAYAGIAMTIGVLVALGIAVWVNRDEHARLESDIRKVTAARVRTTITSDVMQEAHGDVVEIRKAAA